MNNIEELKQDRAKKFDGLTIQQWKLERQLEAVKEEAMKMLGGWEALNEVKECVNDDKQRVEDGSSPDSGG